MKQASIRDGQFSCSPELEELLPALCGKLKTSRSEAIRRLFLELGIEIAESLEQVESQDHLHGLSLTLTFDDQSWERFCWLTTVRNDLPGG